jgi:acetoin:2,6-dichlorophenolindophenol oxidoreductase subunit alpha
MDEKEFKELKALFPQMTQMEAPPELGADEQMEMLKTMMLIRGFETAIPGLWKRNLIYGIAHAYEGAEAIGVGTCFQLNQGDYITSTHRGHGHCIAKGGDVNRMMAEIMGKYEGYCNGKGGSMHIADVENGMLGANGIVGANIGMATGAALRAKIKGHSDVTVCFHGDGGTNQGVWHESINMASIWDLPVVFLVENNAWSISLDYDRAFNVENISDRAVAYGIPGVTVDGFNVFEVYKAAKTAIDRARAGEGPSIVEARFFRYVGHFVADDERYRDKNQNEPWKALDPIRRLTEYMLENKLASEADIEAAQAEAAGKIEAAIEFGIQGSEPAPETLLDGLYAD